MQSLKILFQRDATDCGSTCLAMVAEYYGCKQDRDYLRKLCDLGKTGVSLFGISKAAEIIGFKTVGGRLPFKILTTQIPLPCIAGRTDL